MHQLTEIETEAISLSPAFRYGSVSLLVRDHTAVTLLLHVPAFVHEDIAAALSACRVEHLWDCVRIRPQRASERLYHIDVALSDDTHHGKRMRHFRHQSMRLTSIASTPRACPSNLYKTRSLTLAHGFDLNLLCVENTETCGVLDAVSEIYKCQREGSAGNPPSPPDAP